MTKRIQKLVMAVAALAALALGGAVFAQAQTAPKAAQEKTSTVDLDNVQSGDQTTPDATTSKTARHHAVRVTARHHAKRVASTTTDGGTVQSGDQSTPDTSGAAESSTSETGGETASGSDGPGGHADAPGSANADHQFQGNE